VECAALTAAIQYPHLTTADDGSIRIGNSRYKVLHLAGGHYHYGWTAEDLLRQHPDLRPEEVYSALTYFYDHYDELVAKLTTVALDGLAPTLSRSELLRRRAAVASSAIREKSAGARGDHGPPAERF
jgi:uncharacterized protein (DUF433 family)